MMVERTKRRHRRTLIEDVEEVEQERHTSGAVSSWQDDEGDYDRGATANTPRRVRLQSAYAFARDFEPPDFIAEPFLRSGNMYGVTAGTNAGKTGFFITLGLAVSSGRSELLGAPVKKGRVIFVSIENPAEARARLVVSARYFGVILAHMPRNLVVISELCTPEELVHSLRPFGDAGLPISLIIVDSYSAMFDGNDMNSAREAVDFLKRLRHATALLGSPAVVVAMHPGRNAGNEDLIPTGSGMVLNMLDTNLVLKKFPADERVDLHWLGKKREAEFKPLSFSFENATSPLIVDSKERPMPLPVMRPHVPSKPEPLALTDARQASPSALVQAMVDHPDGPQRTWAAAVGCSQAMIGKHLKRLEQDGLAASLKGRWMLTEKGREGVGK